MKWSKNSIIVVAVIFAISYINTLKSDSKKSDQIWAQTLKQCEKGQIKNCDTIKEYHDICFAMSYRSKFKAKHFFKNEYDACMQRQLFP